MEKIALNDNLSLSRIVYGMWRLGDDSDTSPKHVQAKIEACLEQGITSMDQADIYGGYMAEEILGEALKAAPALKDQIEIVTKCDIVAPAGRYAAARKVSTIGVSNFRPWDWTLLQSAMQAPLVTNQIELSLAASEGFTNGDLAFLQERGVPPMAWSPLGGGSLMQDTGSLRAKIDEVAAAHGVDAAAVAVAWLLAHPAYILPVMGTNNINRIKALGSAMKVEMDRETWFDLYTAAIGDEVP